MAIQKQVYKNPRKNSFITIVVSGCKTPILPIKFSNLIRPFYYPNSPTIPRYSISAIFNPHRHGQLLASIQTIEKNEGVDTILKPDFVRDGNENVETGDMLIKFQTKNKIPVYMIQEGQTDDEAEEMELQDELARGEMVQVVYDVLRYTKKDSEPTQYGLSFKPTKIYYFPHLSKAEKGENDGDR